MFPRSCQCRKSLIFVLLHGRNSQAIESISKEAKMTTQSSSGGTGNTAIVAIVVILIIVVGAYFLFIAPGGGGGGGGNTIIPTLPSIIPTATM
jgi:hypothetical protein